MRIGVYRIVSTRLGRDSTSTQAPGPDNNSNPGPMRPEEADGVTMDIKTMVDRIVKDGRLTRKELQQFQSAVYEDGKIDDEENAQITRLFEMVQRGELEVE